MYYWILAGIVLFAIVVVMGRDLYADWRRRRR